MTGKHPIETVPRDRPVILHGGGYLCGTTGKQIVGSAQAWWQRGMWVMTEVYAPLGYEGPSAWSEVEV